MSSIQLRTIISGLPELSISELDTLAKEIVKAIPMANSYSIDDLSGPVSACFPPGQQISNPILIGGIVYEDMTKGIK